MSKPLNRLRPVYIVGIGIHRYQRPSDLPYVDLGLFAVREALTDAGISWKDVESAQIGKALLGMAPGRPMPLGEVFNTVQPERARTCPREQAAAAWSNSARTMPPVMLGMVRRPSGVVRSAPASTIGLQPSMMASSA